MSIDLSDLNSDPRYTRRGGIHVPANTGETKWFSGDVYTVRLGAAATNGSIGIVEASVPPGSGPVAHTHADQDETFYLLSGELEFLDGDRIFTASAGDIVFIPRTIRHRFKNVGLHTAKMLFLYTPGGAEDLFLEGGDEPEPGVAVQAWGPERFDERILGLFRKHGVEALPEDW
ncbi:cupin domain-containing protein [Micromonospora musae]|uniref:cupin domain-containing protein n=1 Tax=Micromonospora musae TaxID=1894970 RepID=UPI003434B9A3